MNINRWILATVGLVVLMMVGCQNLTFSSSAPSFDCEILISGVWSDTESENLHLSNNTIWGQYKLGFDEAGNIYILQTEANQILVFDSEGRFRNRIVPPSPDIETFSDFGVASDGNIFVAISTPINRSIEGDQQIITAYSSIYRFNYQGDFLGVFDDWRDTSWFQNRIASGYTTQIPFQFLAITPTGIVFSIWGATGEVSHYPLGEEATVIYSGGVNLDTVLMGWDENLYISERLIENGDQIRVIDSASGEVVELKPYTEFDTEDISRIGLLRGIDSDGNYYFDSGSYNFDSNGTLLTQNRVLSVFLPSNESLYQWEHTGYLAGIDHNAYLYLFTFGEILNNGEEIFNIMQCKN